MLNKTFSVVITGTTSDGVMIPEGSRLVGFLLPTLDSTTITVKLAETNQGSPTYLTPYDTTGSIAVCGPAANTGDRYITVPEALSLLTEGHAVQLTVAAQNTAARSIIGICAHALQH